MKATEQALSELHNLTAQVLTARLKEMLRGEIETDPKILANAIKFLRDNNIECTPDDMRRVFKLEGIELPSFEDLTKENEA